MKIIEPKVAPVFHFSFPVTIFTLSKGREKLYGIGILLLICYFFYATYIVAGAYRWGRHTDHFLVQHREVYYAFIALLALMLFLPLVFPKMLSNGHIVIEATRISVFRRGRKPLQMELPKSEIRTASIDIPSKYSRSIIRSVSSLRLQDGRKIEFEVVATSVRDKQGIRLQYILEAALKGKEESGFSVS